MTAEITLTLENDTVLQTIKQLLSNIKGVITIDKINDTTAYSEAEWQEKLQHSSQQAAQGQVHAMQDDETIDEYIDRLLCIA